MEEAASNLSRRRSAARQGDRKRYGAKREQIIAAAGPVLEKSGLHGATVGAIATAAGVDRATVYYYFPDKYAIFRAAIHDGLQEMFQSLDAVAADSGPAASRLQAAVRVVMDVFERHYPYLYIYFRAGSTSEVIDQGVSAETLNSGIRYEEVLREIIDDGVRNGEFDEHMTPKITVNMIVGMLNWTYTWFQPDRGLSGKEIADGMTQLFIEGLAPSSVSDVH